MPSTNVPVQSTTRTGTVLGAGTACDTVNGNNFVNDGQTELVINNTDATSKTVNVKVVASAYPDGNTVADKAFAVTNGVQKAFGPFPVAIYGTQVELTCNSALVKITPRNIPS